jgi:hypothetical protein
VANHVTESARRDLAFDLAVVEWRGCGTPRELSDNRRSASAGGEKDGDVPMA